MTKFSQTLKTLMILEWEKSAMETEERIREIVRTEAALEADILNRALHTLREAADFRWKEMDLLVEELMDPAILGGPHA